MRRFFAPEVIQTSAMDCGPASLKALLEGFGIGASYGRLREACFTGLDGTSIDQIEDAAVQLGLDAEQIMLPADHVLLDDAAALPALVVVRLPMGATHFVVAWRRCGRWIQVMDPGSGRRWCTREQFLSDLYIHSHQLPSKEWREWAGSANFLGPLDSRMRVLGIHADDRSRIIASAVADESADTLATLDAAVRLAQSLVEEGALARSPALSHFVEGAMHSPGAIPEAWWSARIDPTDRTRITIRGAVLMRVKGTQKPLDIARAELSRGFEDALAEHALSPIALLLRTLRGSLRFQALLFAALALAAVGVVAEAVLFRGLFELAGLLTTGPQRYLAVGALGIFFAAVTLIEFALSQAVFETGRRFEGSVRVEFLRKIPRLADSYFRSRLMSDMAERAHIAHRLRDLPALAAAITRVTFGLVFTVAGISWLYPQSRTPALIAAVAAVVVPLFAHPWLTEQDFRTRTHSGALSRFFLDALLGLTAVGAHGAGRAIEREHGNLLGEWARAALKAGRSVVLAQTFQSTLCSVIMAWLLIARLRSDGETGGILLLVYWALSIPARGQELAMLASQYPRLRNALLRFTEPLGAREEAAVGAVGKGARTQTAPAGTAIMMEDVVVSASGHTVLQDINLRIEPGEHVVVIGMSGAGKSTLAGLLLGWNKPAGGKLRVDGEILDASSLTRLRASTVWVSPQVQLWNQPLLDNLRYGSDDNLAAIGSVLDEAELTTVIEKLPSGMQTSLGESGRLLSGGEAQRVRFGRALFHPAVRLAILDEAFRGLERGRRRMLLEGARRRWKDATLLHITHDLSETLRFSRVLVMDGGRIVEDGSPEELYRRSGSRYRALLDAEEAAQDCVWSDPAWRKFTMQDGRLSEEIPAAQGREATC